jgi:hypothetical protein
MEYNVVATGEVKVDVYCGDSCEEHKPYIETQCEGDMATEQMDDFSFDAKRFPAGTKITVEVPTCPNDDCELDAEYQDENKKCECGFDWKVWAEEQYS